MTKVYLLFSAAIAALMMALPGPQDPVSNPVSPSPPASAAAPTSDDPNYSVALPTLSTVAPYAYPGVPQNAAVNLLESTGLTGAGVYNQHQSEMPRALQLYRDAKNDDEKAKARDEIKVQLATQYDELLSHQDHQIKELEDRIAKLKDQLVRRRDAKEKMVNLKLEMVLSQADGLGWPDNSPTSRNPFGGVAVGFGPAEWSHAYPAQNRANSERDRADAYRKPVPVRQPAIETKR